MENKKIAWISLCLLLGSGALIWLWNPGYGRMGERGYETAMALYSACNLKDVKRLEVIEELVREGLANGELQPREGEWLQGIIDRAKAGHWESASTSLRRLMNDQIQSPTPLPELHE